MGRGQRGRLLLVVEFICSPLVSCFNFPPSLTHFSPSFSLSLLAPPKFTKTPTDQIGVSGGVASFVCQATGNPKPSVYWNKKGKKVNSQRIEVVVTVLNVQLLL